MRLPAGGRPYLALAALALVIPAPGMLPGRAFAPTAWLFPAAGAPAGRISLQWDVALQAHPWLLHEARELREGRVPLWNPWSLCGAPFLGNIQTSALSPFTLTAAALPLPFAIALAAWLKLFVAGAGMFAWLRLLGLGTRGALAGAVPFMFNGFLIAALRWSHSGAVVWLPWLLACVERLRRAPGAGAAGALAAVAALQFFGGHPPTAVHLAAVSVAYAVVRLPAAGRGRYAAGVAGGWTAGVLIAAPVLLPFLDYLMRSVVWEARRDGFGGCLSFREALAWFLPDYHGSPVRPPAWHGGGANPYDSAAAPGMAVWVLAPAGWLAAGPALRRTAWFLVAVAIAGAGLAVCVPGLHPLLAALPPFSLINGVRGGLLVAFAACGLAAVAVDALAGGGARAARAVAAIRWSAVALIAMIAGILLADGEAITAGRGWGVAGPAAALGVILAGAMAFAARGGRALMTLLLLCASPDLLRFGLRWNETSPAGSFYPETPAIAALRVKPHDRSVISPVNLGTAYGVREAGGFDSMTPAVVRDRLGGPETGGPAGTGPLIPRAGRDDRALNRARLDGPGRVRFVEDDPGRVLLFAEAARGTRLVLADTHDPGWRAVVNGSRVRIDLADTAFRSVEIPAEQSVVRFTYDPLPFKAGLWLAALVLGGIAALAFGRGPVY